MKVFHQSGEDGAISTLRAATDPSLTGQGFKYFGPWYKGPLIIHTGNDSKLSSSLRPFSVLTLQYISVSSTGLIFLWYIFFS